MTDFPEGHQGAGPMFAAVPDMSEQWYQLAASGADTYVVDRSFPDPGSEDPAFLDRTDAKAVADATPGSVVWHWTGQLGHREPQSEPEAGS